MYYVLCKSLEERSALISALKESGVMAVFHYLSLHSSSFYAAKHGERKLPHSDYFSDCLLRLPMYFELSKEDQARICDVILDFYNKL